MNEVYTPDGWGQVLRTETARGRTSYLVKGAAFEGWYDALQVTGADDAGDWSDTLAPGDLDTDNTTTLPYPSRPQGPGWDQEETIQPGIEAHIERGTPSNSLTGEPSDEDPVQADIDGLFEPHSKLSGRAPRRLHFAGSDDPILEVSRLPEESPSDTGADTDDLFDDTPSHIASVTYDRLVIEDDLSFLRLAAEDDDDDKKDRRDDDSDDDGHDRDDDDSEDDGDSDSDDEGDSSSDDDESHGRDGDDDGDGDSAGDGDGGGSHTASFALTTTADLHFLANFCTEANCDDVPLHSKLEHRESGLKQKRRKNQPLGNKPLKGEHNPKAAINTPKDAGYSSDTKGVGKTVKRNPKRRQDKGQWGVNALEPIHADFDGQSKKHPPANGVTPQEYDLDKQLEMATDDEMQQWTHQESNLPNLVDHSQDNGDSGDGYRRKLAADDDSEKETEFVKRGGDGWVLLQHGDNPKTGKKDGEPIFTAATRAAVIKHLDAIEYAKHGSAKTAAPAAAPQPTQIESQIEQLMQFWACDNNGWWHWTGSQGDLALLNQMQQQMAVVGMPQGQPGAMQAQSAVETGFELEANTPARWRSYLQTLASDRLVALAAWKDVVEKSKRLRAEGAIHVEAFRPDVITARVQGDNGEYYTTVQRLGSVQGLGRQNMTSGQVSGWSCDCEWGQWAWLRKRSFVGRMCSHAYALFSEMRSMDAQARKSKGKPGRFASVTKSSWARTAAGGFEWVSDDPLAPTAAIIRSAAGWTAHVWSDGTAEDSLSLGTFSNSGSAGRAAARVITAHVKLADDSVDVVGGDSPYAEDGDKDPSDGAHIQESTDDDGDGDGSPRYSSFSLFAADDGQDDEGDEKTDDGQDDEDDPRDDESLDEEIAEDEDDSDDGQDDDGGEEPKSDDDGEGDGGHWEKHHRDDGDDDEGTDNPGDESDDHHVEKQSSVTELQQQYGLTHLAGKNYTLQEQAELVNEGQGRFASNLVNVNDANSMYAGKKMGAGSAAEDVLAFLF